MNIFDLQSHYCARKSVGLYGDINKYKDVTMPCNFHALQYFYFLEGNLDHLCLSRSRMLRKGHCHQTHTWFWHMGSWFFSSVGWTSACSKQVSGHSICLSCTIQSGFVTACATMSKKRAGKMTKYIPPNYWSMQVGLVHLVLKSYCMTHFFDLPTQNVVKSMYCFNFYFPSTKSPYHIVVTGQMYCPSLTLSSLSSENVSTMIPNTMFSPMVVTMMKKEMS